MFYVGIDWGDKEHKVFITDDSGKRLDAFSVKHLAKEVDTIFEKVQRFASEQKEVLFGLETSRGLLVNSVLDKGYVVYALNPKSVDRYRDRYKVSKVKDDYFDAMVIANILRTDRENYRPILPDSKLTRELRFLTRDCEKLKRMKTMILNQILSCLKEYYPLAASLFSDLDSKISIAFLKAFPDREKLRDITVKKLEGFLAENHYPSASRKAFEIYEKLKEPQFNVEPFIIRAKSQYMLSLVNQLEVLVHEICVFEKKIEELLENHPDKDIFLSLPGAGKGLASRLISEFGDNRERYKKASSVQAEAGTAPVTRQSGSFKSVIFRRACRKTFRNAMHHFAFSSIKESVWARERYDRYVGKDKRNAHALRCLANAWLEVIFSMWKNHSPYNDQRHLLKNFKEHEPVDCSYAIAYS